MGTIRLTGRTRILVLCGNDAAAVTAANVYADRFCDHELLFVEEQVVSLRRTILFSKRRLRSKGLLSLLGSYLYYGMRLFFPGRMPRKRYVPAHVTSDFSASDTLRAAIRSFRPDVVLVAFCGLLRPDFLDELPAAAYNIHPGINPRYRGFGNIWALYENDPQCLGYTIHRVDAGIDTGERLAAVRLSPWQLAGVDFAHLDVPVSGVAAEHLCDLLLGLREPHVEPWFREMPSQYYGVPTLTAFLTARKHFRRALGQTPRTVLVTGASSGIGSALAEAYAGPTTRLILWARDEQRLEAVAARCRDKGSECVAVYRDIADLAQSRQTLEALHRQYGINLAVLGAGVSSGTLPDGLPEPVEAACRTVHINETATINLIGTMSRLLTASGSGHIAALASVAALYPLPDSPAYSAAKAGLATYVAAIRPLFPTVRMTNILPGYVSTPMSKRLQGPQPMVWPAAKAARHIRLRLDANREVIVFPVLLAAGIVLLHLLPNRLASFFLKRFAFSIQPDQRNFPPAEDIDA